MDNRPGKKRIRMLVMLFLLPEVLRRGQDRRDGNFRLRSRRILRAENPSRDEHGKCDG